MSNNVPDSVMKLIHDDLQTEVIKVFFVCFMLVEIFSVLTDKYFLFVITIRFLYLRQIQSEVVCLGWSEYYHHNLTPSDCDSHTWKLS